MGKDDFISDDEELYRSIRSQPDYDEYNYNDAGQLIITYQAFSDRFKKPSVDRAKLRNFTPSLSKLSKTDGIVSLNTKDVRCIGEVETKEGDGNLIRSVDVVYDPICEVPKNLAHSQITVVPEFFGSEKKQKKAFRLLRIALARLATKTGWTLNP